MEALRSQEGGAGGRGWAVPMGGLEGPRRDLLRGHCHRAALRTTQTSFLKGGTKVNGP